MLRIQIRKIPNTFSSLNPNAKIQVRIYVGQSLDGGMYRSFFPATHGSLSSSNFEAANIRAVRNPAG
jgi:hypothetical protein